MESLILSSTLTLPPFKNSKYSIISSSSSSFLSTTNLNKKSNVSVLVRTGRNRNMQCKCLFGLGVPELVVIAGVSALLFGPKNLPDVGRSIGKTVKSFQQAAKEFETELKKEPTSALDPLEEKPITANEERKEEIQATTIKESVKDFPSS